MLPTRQILFCVVQMLLVIRDKSTEQPLRAENQVGVGLPSDKQTIKTLEEAPEGAPLNVIVRAPSSETLEVSWKVKFLHSHANTVSMTLLKYIFCIFVANG